MSEPNKDADRKQPETKEEQSPKREKHETKSGKIPPQLNDDTPVHENRGD